MLWIFKRNEEEARNLRELLEKKSKEIETSAWISTAILTSDGLRVFLKRKNENYDVERVLPYAIKLFQTAQKFHTKANPGLKVGGFEPPRTLFYQMDTREIVIVMKGFSKKLDFFLVYIADPELSPHFSIDKAIKKLHAWLYKTSKLIDDKLPLEGERK